MSTTCIPLPEVTRSKQGDAMGEMNILLSGIVGSTAYGLAGPDSDVDRLGIFAAPTETLIGLHPPTERQLTIVRNEPSDRVFHEVGKACRLMLRSNPSITEILWLPDELYEVRTELGTSLIGIRSAFLCRPRVKSAFLGYAGDQLRRLINRGQFQSTYRARVSKHSRHVARLLISGLELYRTGVLTPRLEDPDSVREFGETAAEDPERVTEMLGAYEAMFAEAKSPLPERPDEAKTERWLHRVRAAYYREPS